MTSASTQPRNAVVVCVDGRGSGDRWVDAAITQARSSHKPLHLVYATGIGIVPWTPELLAARHQLARRCHRRAADLAPDLRITFSVHVENTAAMLVKASESASLVVVTAGGQGQAGDVLLGQTSLKVVAHARCPVLVIPSYSHWGDTGPIVVGVDAAEHSVPALGWAFAEASAQGAPLVALHASWWEPPSPLVEGVEPDIAWNEMMISQEVLLSEMLAGRREKYPEVEVEATVARDQAATMLEALSSTARLVVGSRGRGGFTGPLLGSVSAHTMHHAHCPVVVVPSTTRERTT